MRRFIVDQISQFGTTIVGVHPGRVETRGVGAGAAIAGSARKLTLDDARALSRIPGVSATLPFVYGTATVEHESRGRQVYIYGATADVPAAWRMNVEQGQFLPRLDYDRGSPVTVLGPRLKRELFGSDNALGELVRIGQERFRVIGVMASKGQYLGFDLDDMAFVPIASAMRLLNRAEVAEIHLVAISPDAIDPVAARARQMMIERHSGNEDVTVVTQKDSQQMVSNILNIITGVVTGIAAISLLVGAIGILTIMWIVVRERFAEIGLAKALGATRAQILSWYLVEAAATAALGGLAGLVLGVGGSQLLAAVVPGLESYTSPVIVTLALGVATGVGLAAGVAPALRAASLDPVEALRAE
jgi:putative ABC transport system permease protein